MLFRSQDNTDQSDAAYERLESVENKLIELIGKDDFYALNGLGSNLMQLKMSDDIEIDFILAETASGSEIDIHATVYDETTVVGRIEPFWD